MAKADFAALTFAETEMDPTTRGRTAEPNPMLDAFEMTDRVIDADGRGLAIEFKLPKGDATPVRVRAADVKDDAGNVIAKKGDTYGGENDVNLVRTTRFLREAAAVKGRGISIQVKDHSKTQWLVKFQSKNARVAAPKPEASA